MGVVAIVIAVCVIVGPWILAYYTEGTLEHAATDYVLRLCSPS